jgi:hypothetical protein
MEAAMNNWLRDIRDAVGMGLIWAVAWAPVGVLIGAIVDPNESMDEPWLMVGMLPGFFCGVLFVLLLRLAEGSGRRAELSLPRAAAWGAVSGLMAPVLFVLAIAAGLGTWKDGQIQWALMAIITGATILGSALSAAVSLALTRRRRAAS